MTRNSFYITIVLLLSGFGLLAQPYGNEWINTDQRYFKIKIGEEGIYRLSHSELSGFGFPVNIVDPRKIQMFHLGQEVAIHVEGQIDGTFNTSDYIEFYAQTNDGSTDTPLYNAPNNQPHQYYNLFSDSSAYFLTFNLTLTNGLRRATYSESNTGGLPTENYFVSSKLELKTDVYYEGQSYGSDNSILLPTYDRGEGWTGTFASLGQNIDYTVTGLTNRIEADINPNLELLLVGGNNNAHNVTIFVGPNTGSLREITTATFDADENYLVTQELEWTDISTGGDLVVRFSINGVGGAADRISVSYIHVSYSKAFDMNGVSEMTMEMKINAANKSYIEINNSPVNVKLYDISSPLAPIEIGINEGVGNFNAIINGTNVSRTLFAQSNLKGITNCQEIEFNSFDPAIYDFLMISHSSLRGNTSSGQGDQVTAYKNYRESVAGGGHQVLDIDIETIFNQFNYGLPSPIAIKRFSEYVYDNGTPKFLFLIGKASNVQANYYRQDPDLATVRHLIPTYGYPGGDVPFSEGFDGGSGYGVLATGRLNASEPDHIEAYLNKVVEEEGLAFNTLRQKNLVFLSGGRTESELNIFKSYINGFADIADGELLGGESTLISKNNNSAVELINISNEINDGVMMVTFFGHSSGSITDIEIGLVSDPAFGYANKGKYPVFLVNGCLAGDFFSENESFGVNWILTPNLGALSFIAHSHVGYSTVLKRYSDLFYEIGFTNPAFISKSVGEIKAETSKAYIANNGASATSVAQVQLMNLQGDPAVKIFGPDKPDYDINEAYLEARTFDNSQLLATVDSFYIEMSIRNFGIYSSDTFDISVTRTFADGRSETYGPNLFNSVLREDTLQFTINNNVQNPTGLNTFTINLDPFNNVAEMDETNNSASIDVFLSSGSTFNLFPSNASIQNNSTIDFYFQSSNLLVGSRDFDIQIDSSATFNSPFLINQTINSKVIGKLNIDLEAQGSVPNGKVFYWRTRFTNPLPEEGDEWVTSSFVLNKTLDDGWSQNNGVQFTEAFIEGLELNPNTGVWNFQEPKLILDIQNYGSDHPSFDYTDTKVLLNGSNYFKTNSHIDPGCRNNSINFLAMKRQSNVPFKPIITPNFDQLQPLVCGLLPQVIYNYTASDISNPTYGPEALISSLEDEDKVLIFSLGTVNYSTWTTEFKDALETLGLNRMDLNDLQDDEPVIMLGAKNAIANSGRIDTLNMEPKNANSIHMKETITGSFDSGEIDSGIIGPALSWSNVSASIVDSSNPSDDTKTLNVYGIQNDKTEVLLFQSNTENSFDLSSIDASLYPFLKLKLNVSDDVLQTPQQLKWWMVTYETAPEGILIPNNLEGVTSTIEIQEGQPLTNSYSFWNFSNKNFTDSINVNFEVFNENGNLAQRDSMNVTPLEAGDSAQFELTFNTFNNLGVNDLVLSTNRNYLNEVYSFNNAARFSKYFNVSPDETNPIVDVSFDGIHIMNGDIVSPTPSIEVHLDDDNSYLLKEDTTGINIYLKRPCETCDFERISFSSPYMTWSPATSEENFKSTFTPERLDDGVYGLRVLANDASGNPSGLKPYEINFEVINASTITNFYPYPNPFSSNTRFVFTLTGSEFPEDIKIQILTVTGRVVKEIFMEELGPINIGNNKTQYAWDGRDNFGDQLANGVYLYRVLIKNPGENFKHRETSADRGFKNGFGKMYLLR